MNAQNEEPIVPMNPSDETMVSRRKLLKALAATSGAVVASQMLPGQWIKPVIESGVLPAHAVGSPTPTATRTPQPGSTATNTPQPGVTPTATPAANVTGKWIIEITVTAVRGSCRNVGDVITANWTMTQTGGTVVGEVTQGSGNQCDTRGNGTVIGNTFSFLMKAYTCCPGAESRLDATTQGNDYFTGIWNELDYPDAPNCCEYNGTVVGRRVS